MDQLWAGTDMGQPWADAYKSSVTTKRDQGCFVFGKCHIEDFPSLLGSAVYGVYAVYG